MHDGAAEDRDHHASQGRRSLIKTTTRGETSMIYVVATSQVKPELRDAFIKGAKECIAATRKEKGCLSYESHVSINDPNLFVVVERWETREDLNAHGRAPHMKVWREYSAPLKVSPTVIEIISDGKVEKF
jgi:quinol monooxygenase YgiN